MTSTPALEWLEDQFTDLSTTWGFPDTKTPGTAVIKPMIQLRSVMDAGKPMTVTSADYAGPQRWWL
jgi:hypothetical protein